MLSFVQQILAFATFEVLEPNWRALELKLAKVTTVDQLLRDHVDLLDTCLKECMLTSSKLLRVRAYVFSIAFRFLILARRTRG
jgi:gamma-tubulin complex component 2